MNPTELRAAVETVAQALERGEVPPLGKPAELAELINEFSRSIMPNPGFDRVAVVNAYAAQLLAQSAQATPAVGGLHFANLSTGFSTILCEGRPVVRETTSLESPMSP